MKLLSLGVYRKGLELRIFENQYYNMKNFRTLTIWVVMLYFVIVVGVGHGVIFIGLLEIFMLPHFFDFSSDNFTFSLTASYDKSISASILFAFIGHVLLITSILIKRRDNKFWLKITGIFFLLLSFYYLAHNLFTDSAAKLSFFCGLPFLSCSLVLLLRIIKEKFNSIPTV
jgi:hypothetical protein